MPNAQAEAQRPRYPILKNICYRNPDSPLYKKIIKPSDPEAAGLPFPHLDPKDIVLLQRKRVLGPALQEKT